MLSISGINNARSQVVKPADSHADDTTETTIQPKLELPTPTELVRASTDVLQDWHPRDPNLRVYGEHHPQTTVPRRDSNKPKGSSEKQDAGKQGSVASAAMLVGMAGGVAVNAIDVARLVKKYPEALRAARFDATLGRLGRLPTALGLTAQLRVDSRIVDPLAPRIASAASMGRSFTRFDQIAMRSSVLLGAGLSAVQIGTAIPNIIDAVSKDGPWYENLLRTTSGRYGVLQLSGGVLGASLFATALRQTASTAAGSGLTGRVLAASTAPIMARPFWGRVGIGSAMVIAANALGYLDPLNKSNDRSVGESMRDAVHKTPILNDPKLRTAALISAGGFTAYKANAALRAAGTGVSHLPKGYLFAGAAITGLLGAQLLGALSGLNKD